MKIVKLTLALAVFVFAASAAHAQLGIYGTATVRRMTSIPYTEGTTSFTNGNFSAVGGTGGIYYDFRNVGPVRLGFDARGSITSANQGAYKGFNGGGAHLNSGLFGVRATFHTPFVPVKPYVEGMVGVARTDFGTQYQQGLLNPGQPIAGGYILSTGFEYNGFAGVDVKLLPLMDFRVIELGYGAVNANSHTFPVGTLSTGFVFHLPFGISK